MVIASVVALDYRCTQVFPGVPYRWHVKLYLKNVVWRGMIINPLINVFFTKGENLSTTKLPVWEIQLSGRKLAALNNDLPLSGRNYQSGTIIIDSSPFPARFRLRGDGFWHWRSKQKSWKIQLKGGQRFEGKKEFNLVNPRCTTTLVWPLSAFIAHSMGLKTPALQHVHARMNGQYLGVLYLVENYDHDFTAHHDLPEGALYEDEALGGPPFYPSWERIDDWEIRPPGSKSKYRAGHAPEEKYEKHLRDFLQCINIKEDKEFFRRLEELVDVNQYLRWWAHATIIMDTHQDSIHNNRLYLDPASAKFQQIPWDMTIGYSRNPHDGIDLNANPVTERLIQSPYYVHCRNRIIWDTLKGPANINEQLQWLDKITELIRPDIYSDPYKDAVDFLFPLFMILSKKYVVSMGNLPVTNEIFEKDVKRIKTFLRERMVYLAHTLSHTDVELAFYSPSGPDVFIPEHYSPAGVLSVKVGGQVGIVVEEITIHVTPLRLSQNPPLLLYGNADTLIKRKGERIQDAGSNDGGVYKFTVNELLLPGREREPPFGPTPVRFPFTIAFAKSGGVLPVPLNVHVKGVHPFTNQEVFLEARLSELKDTRNLIPMGKFQSPPPIPQKILWSSFKKINQDFLVTKGEILIINPGTRIELSQGASLLSHGRIMAVGTAALPIVFTRTPDSSSWGVVALQSSGASGSVFEHCIFEYGSDDELEEVFYSGALSLYNADTTIKNCLFRFSQGDDALNTKFSNTDVTGTTFINNTADGYDLDFSSGLITQNRFEKNGNDGIDCGTAHPTIRDNNISYCGDKGISIGERSNPIVEGNLVAHCKVGIAVKDQSHPEIARNEFQHNEIAVGAYQKKKAFGGAQVVIHKSTFQGNKSVSESDELSSVRLIDCVVDDGMYQQN